jgi:DNA repair exonuclease SbcCD ATPase subunit
MTDKTLRAQLADCQQAREEYRHEFNAECRAHTHTFMQVEMLKHDINRLSETNSELATEIERLIAEIEIIKRVSLGPDCGCNPCRGQCTSAESLQVVLDQIHDMTSKALAETKP